MKRKPTIDDVAREAGVTKGTVSHVFNGHRPISETTKQRVIDTAAKLGWVPNSSARALAAKRCNAIGIVLARDPQVLHSDMFFSVFLSGVESVLVKSEVALVLQMVSDRQAEARAYRSMYQGRVDGFIVLDLTYSDWRIDLLRELEASVVLVQSSNDNQAPDFSSVWVDDRAPMRTLVRTLKTRGHHRVAHISGPLRYVHSNERVISYLDETGTDEFLREGNFTAESGLKLTRELLSLEQPPTAIIYSNDVMAIAGLSYAQSIGMSIPEDLSIAGFDDDPISVHLNPPMTSVSTNAYERGQLAAKQLLAVIQGGTPQSIEVQRPKVRWRKSTEGTMLD